MKSTTDGSHETLDRSAVEPHEAALSRLLLRRLDALGLPYGREDSFKLRPGGLISDRVLVGVQAAGAAPDALFTLAAELGMPKEAGQVLSARLADANAVFFGTEEAGATRVAKVYLEFWDQVRRQVRAGDTGAQLLHLGVKWSTSRPGHFEQARYVCHPLLGARDVLRRMGLAYAGLGSAARNLELARTVIRQALKRTPQAALLYLEVRESDNARQSYDINLYKTGLRVADVAGELRQAAANFGIEGVVLEAALQRLGSCPLGHLSGGSDRRGEEFLSVYGEIRPLPDLPS